MSRSGTVVVSRREGGMSSVTDSPAWLTSAGPGATQGASTRKWTRPPGTGMVLTEGVQSGSAPAGSGVEGGETAAAAAMFGAVDGAVCATSPGTAGLSGSNTGSGDKGSSG